MPRKSTPPPVTVLTAQAQKGRVKVSVSRDDLTDLLILFDPPPDEQRTIRMFDLFAARPDQLPKVEYLVDGLVFQRGLWFIAGPPKHGKSLIRRHLAVCIALGEPFFGHAVKKGRVVIVADEDEAADELRVMRWMAAALGRDPEERRGQMYLIPPCALKVDDRWDVKAITALLKEVDPAIFFLDPLIRYHDQEENSNTDMQAVIRPLADLARKQSVCVVHHSPIERPGDLRGGGDLGASYKALWKVVGKEGDMSSIGVTPLLKAGPQPDKFRVGYHFDDANERLLIWSPKAGVPRLVDLAKKVLHEHGSFSTKNAWLKAAGRVRKQDFLKAIGWLIRRKVVVHEDGIYHFAVEDASNE